MPQCVVIADDLTGANATGVLLTKIGYRAFTMMNADSPLPGGSGQGGFDCVMIPTASRSLAPEEAALRVRRATEAHRSPRVSLYTKRIDTTLRGNLGAETDAMLDVLGPDRVAMIVPCFPGSSRINVGGYLLVHGIPLHKTEAAADPKNPMNTPLCSELYARQGKHRHASLFVEDLMRGRDHLAARIRGFAAEGARYIIFDAITQEDVDLIADAVIDSKVPFLAVDPGVFTATLARKLIPPSQSRKNVRILAAVGSVNPVAARQAELFLASQNVLNVYMRAEEFLGGDARRDDEVRRVVDAVLAQCDKYDVCSVIGMGIKSEYRIRLDDYASQRRCSTDDLSEIINSSIAGIVYRIVMADDSFRGVYTSGCDITVSVCRCLNTAGFQLLDEVLPLAAYGELMGGERDGLKVVTKGGMVGDQEAMLDCVRYLKEKLSM